MKKTIILIITLWFLFAIQQSFANYGIQTKTSNCIANQTLPDIACSPWAVLTTDTKIICKSGYTKTVRDVPLSERKKVFAEYNIAYSKNNNYEVDHIISLELWGSNDISNLFPESYLISNGAKIKDEFENYLHKQVCIGKLSIQEAQKEISSNRAYYYQQYLGVKSSKVETSSTGNTVKAKIWTPTVVSGSNQTNLQTPSTGKVTKTPTNIPDNNQPNVKKSTTGICHEKGTTYYNATKNFTPYNSIAECLASGWRLPK